MELTHHWVQRAGARAVAALCGRSHPRQVGGADLDQVCERIVQDAVMAATAPKDGPGRAWWLALAAAYPNAPVTHPSRIKRSPQELEALVREQFTPDTGARWHCPCCDAPAAQRWGKSLWPLAESISYLNTAQGGVPGIPVCRSCRITAWALPYASHNNGAELLTVDTDDEDLAALVTSIHLERNLAAIDQRATSWPRGWSQAALAEAVAAHPAPMTAQRWRNDNREPFLYRSWIIESAARWWSLLGQAHRDLVTDLAGDRPVWYVLAENQVTHDQRPTRLLSTLSYATRTAALEELAADQRLGPRSWNLALAADYLDALGYAAEAGIDPHRDLIETLARKVAALLDDPADLAAFVEGRTRLEHWRDWLQTHAVEHLLRTTDAQPFVTTQQWDLLFGQGSVYYYRDRLLTRVLALCCELQPA